MEGAEEGKQSEEYIVRLVTLCARIHWLVTALANLNHVEFFMLSLYFLAAPYSIY